MKRLLSGILSLIMVFGCFSGISVPARATENVYDESESVNSANTTEPTCVETEYAEVETIGEDLVPEATVAPVVEDTPVENTEDVTEVTTPAVSVKSATKSATAGLYYFIADGEVWITDYTGSASSVVIPDQIDGYPVTTIGSTVFFNCTSMTSITIPDSVTFIGSSAFSGCSSLSTVHISDVAAWCGIQFADLSANPLLYAEKLYLNGKLVTDLVIPNSVTHIGDYAFSRYTALTSVTIPDSVTSIGSSAFYDCTSLKYNVYNYGLYLGNSKNPYLFLAKASSTSITSCQIHTNTKFIACRAFHNCTSLTSITIPDRVTSIGDYAFYDCTSLTSITIPDSVTSIGDSAFCDCDSLTSITIPDSVTSIGDEAFHSCDSLTSITIPDSVTSIGDEAFRWCDSLTSITIGNGVTSIGNGAFEYCWRLTSITIGNGVTSIGNGAFEGCDALTSVVYIGTKAMWDAIRISSNNTNLTSANRIYLTKPPTAHQITANSVQLAFHQGMEYSMDGKNWQESNIFTGLHPGTKYTFYQRFAATDTAESGSISAASVIITQAIPIKPILAECTSTTITLQKLEGYEYSKNGTTWQSSNNFTGLSANTKYTFYQRIAATDTSNASPASSALTVKTAAKGNCSIAPVKPVIVSYTDTKVELVARTGYEYSKDGKTWQSSAVFSGLTPDTQYTFYQRIKETNTELASNASEGIKVTTAARNESDFAANYDMLYAYITDYGDEPYDDYSYAIIPLHYYKSGDRQSFITAATTAEGIRLTLTVTPLKPSTTTITSCTTVMLTRTSSNVVVENLTYQGLSSAEASRMAQSCITISKSKYTESDVYDFSLKADLLYNFPYDTYNTLTSQSLGILINGFDLGLYELFRLGAANFGFAAYDGLGKICYNSNHIGILVLRGERPATCTINGYSGDYYCNACGAKIKSGTTIKATGAHKYTNACDKDCNTCGEERIITHSYSGYCDKDCNICGVSRTVLLDHYYGNGTSQNSTNHIESCTGCGITKVSPHSWDEGVITQVPTCNSEGVYTYTCVGCPHTKTESIPAAHNFGDWVKVDADTHSHTCATCKTTESKSHDWDNGKLTQKPTGDIPGIMTYTCTTCAATKTEEVDFIPGDIDGSGQVNRDDVIQLLLHVSMPAVFPIDIPADYTGDNQITRDDVIQLLLHVSMPNVFPL